MRVGQWLLSQRMNKIKLPPLAKALGVSERTLRNWRSSANRQNIPKMGRPSYSEEAHKFAMWVVGREIRRQQYPGWRPIAAAYEGVPVRLVQYYVSLFKASQQKRIENRKKQNRIGTQVLARNAIWSQDGAHLGRIGNRPIEGQVIKDRAPLKTVGVIVGPPANANTIVPLLAQLKKSRGLPFVLSTDNGSPYCNDIVKTFLENEKVIHLRSLPHTPEHNGAAEIIIRELKRISMLGGGVNLTSVEDTYSLLTKKVDDLDANRLLGSKGFKTANQLDDSVPGVQEQDRDRFYTICLTRMQQAAAPVKNAREARRIEREMIFCTLEDFGLITRTRNGRPYTPQKTEIFS